MAAEREDGPTGPSGRAYGDAASRAGTRDEQYDLLTAALIGAVVGASATLLFRRPQLRRRPHGMAHRAATRAGSAARRAGGALRPDDAAEYVREALGAARQRIDDAVDAELRDLRRAVRRQRKKLGL